MGEQQQSKQPKYGADEYKASRIWREIIVVLNEKS